MKIPFLCLLFCLFSGRASAQARYTAAHVHAHNDYVQPIPFFTAYHQQVGSIEADVFLRNGELYVAHEPRQIRPENTLEALYLQPLQTMIAKNNGNAYPRKEAALQLLIDLKTAGPATLPVLVQQLARYPTLIRNPRVRIVISGHKPAPATWAQYPAYIYFDGTPGEKYTAAEQKRLGLVSASFRQYTQWNGKGLIIKEEREKIQRVIDSVHRQQQKIRFWATPDNSNTWQTLMRLGVDYIGTDDVMGLTGYLNKLPASQYQHPAAAAVYRPTYKTDDRPQPVKNIILLIGDGMGLAQMYAGYTALAGRLNLFNMRNLGLATTASADSYITDSAAGATALATGQQTNNRHVGVDTAGRPLAALPELMAAKGMKSALISTGDITDATPACFYAHQSERSLSEAIAADFLTSPVSILIGGNYAAFAQRQDAKSLIPALQQRGYVTANRFAALDTITAAKYVVLDNAAVVPKAQGRGDFLVKSLRKAIGTLNKNPNQPGFFIMAEGAQIDHGGHANNVAFTVQEMLDFDQAVGEALQFADQNGETLVLVTADHETGGLSLLDGNLKQGYVAGHFSTDDHSAIPVPVFAYGPHSLDFRGVYPNTALFQKIRQLVQRYH